MPTPMVEFRYLGLLGEGGTHLGKLLDQCRQGSANYLLPVFINKVLLDTDAHIPFQIAWGCFQLSQKS